MFRAILRQGGGFSGIQKVFVANNSNFLSIPKLTFEDMKIVINRPSTFLLDVREKEELISDGRIKEAHNIPWEVETAIKLDKKSFKAKYGFDKPDADKNDIVVHCKAGVRALEAAVSLNQAGYSNVKVYDGIMDWLSNGGSLVK